MILRRRLLINICQQNCASNVAAYRLGGNIFCGVKVLDARTHTPRLTVDAMKDAVNYLLPVVQDPMNELTGRCLSHHVSHNGYYGYQPVAAKGSGVDKEEKMETVTTDDMDIQFNNLMEPDDEAPPQQPQQPSSQNRKRMWMFDEDVPNCKKRREIESLPYTAERACSNDQNSNGNRHTHSRQPTHNVPDMPRCMMGAKPDDDEALLEELLRETHGGSWHHWPGHEI